MKFDPGPLPKSAKSPQLGPLGVPSKLCFSFSLRYWNQIDYFGLGKSNPGWFISLLNRLRELCNEPVERFLDDSRFQYELRFHEANWNAHNIPITPDDLGLPAKFRNNLKERPIFQIHISKAMGRILGFWDDEVPSCFNIVLFDPLHNFNPSKDVNYALSNTTIGKCEYSSLRDQLDRVCDQQCNSVGCPLEDAVRALNNGISLDTLAEHTVVIAQLPPKVAFELKTLRTGTGLPSISELLEHGLLFWNEGKSNI